MALVLAKMLKRMVVFRPLRSMHANMASSTIPEKKIEFICGDQVFTGKAKVGDSLLDVVLNNDLPLDGFGACEGTLACCTCHVVLGAEHFSKVDKLNPYSEEELYLLDLAPELYDNSRLGCQVKIVIEDADKMSIVVPTQTRDARSL